VSEDLKSHTTKILQRRVFEFDVECELNSEVEVEAGCDVISVM
jgi:hypothetical protein